METLLPLQLFSRVGHVILLVLLVLASLSGFSGMINLVRPVKVLSRFGGVMLALTTAVFLAGFFWICWFHYQIADHGSSGKPAAAL